MELMLLIVIGALVLLVLALSTFLVKAIKKTKSYESKYAAIIDIDSEVEKSKVEKNKTEGEIEALKDSYKEKKAIYDKLVKQAAIYDEEIQLAELGFYKPHYDFDTSEKYKDQIDKVRANQKEIISAKTAIFCNTEWTVEGSKTKGRTMSNRAIRLTARAFNNECDAAISNTRWNNADRMEKRIEKAFESINKLNESNKVFIDQKYLQLKLEELRLTQEYKDKKQQEKEEQAEIKRQMREEVKLQQEAERALNEEEKYKKLLDKAKGEAAKAAGDELEKLNEKIASLGQELEEAHAKSERAISMAQQTKSGHVYVISNMGSFGENVYKIGMTRRLEPLDRVKELGDASVPFLFDVHAIIYSEDAPALENAIQRNFDSRRLNLVNQRKEFFNVHLSDIEDEVKKIAPEAEFIETAEAREYRESQSIRAQKEKVASEVELPNEI